MPKDSKTVDELWWEGSDLHIITADGVHACYEGAEVIEENYSVDPEVMTVEVLKTPPLSEKEIEQVLDWHKNTPDLFLAEVLTKHSKESKR